MNPQGKAGVEHWDNTWARLPRMRLPPARTSLRGVVRLGLKFLEIGCTPWKILASAAAVWGAEVGAGAIEHFEDPSGIVRIHAQLLNPGGVALVTAPNPGGFYKHLGSQPTWAIHNPGVVTPQPLRGLALPDLSEFVERFHRGRFTLATDESDGGWGRLATVLRTASDLLGLAQPFLIEALCSTLLLKIRRQS